MKKLLKIVSLIMSIVMMITVIPMFSMFSAMAEDGEAWDYYILQDHNTALAPPIDDTSKIGWGADSNYVKLPNREWVSDYTPEGTKWALKLTNPMSDNNKNNLYFVNLFNADYVESSAGMRMWVANPSENAVGIWWCYYNGANAWGTVGSNKAYYLQSENSNKVYSRTTEASSDAAYGTISIPAGFNGWLYVPYTSASTGVRTDYSRVRFFIPGSTEKDVTIYTSRIEYYSKTAVTPQTTYDYGFDTLVPYSDASDVNTAVVNPRGQSTVTLDTTVHDGESGQSIKVTYANGTINSGTAIQLRLETFCKDSANDNADGISFWTNNSNDFDVTLTIMTNNYGNINKNAPYYLKPDGDDAYVAYTTNAPFESRTAIIIPANFTGKIYLPYSLSNTSATMKAGHLALTAYLTQGMPTVTMNFDSLGNYNFEDIGNVTTQTFDNLTDLSGVMWNNTGDTVLATEVTDGNSGKSAKAKVSASANVLHRFNNLAPSNDIANYSGRLGYRFWVSNPNNFEVSAKLEFFNTYNRAIVNREYYLEYESGGCTVNKFKALTSDTERGCITLPANFRGYVYVPQESIHDTANKPVTDSNSWLFIVTVLPAEQDSYIYLDSYGMYTEEFSTANKLRAIPTVFSDGALFQQNKPINVWGYNVSGSETTATLYKGDTLVESKSAIANKDGKFEMSFAALEGSYDTYRIVFSDANGIITTVNDVLIGELWLSGGQSNMEFSIGDMAGKDEFLTKFADVADKIRVFVEPARPFPSGTVQPMTPCDDIQGAYWIDGTNTRDINVETSAVACVFAYELQKKLNVPVGIIDTAISGTMISSWLSREATENNEEVLEIIKDRNLYKEIDEEITGYNTWTVNYNSKIAPLAGLNIKGTIWYQGEADIAEPSQYVAQLDLLKESWGKDFGFKNDDMPFIYTQVAPDCYDSAQKDWFMLGYMAEAMTDAYRLNENNNTAMITIYDVPLDYGMQGSIHPNTKRPVGERFAQSAINLCYNGGNEASAPMFKNIEIKGDTIYVNFTHVGEGLECLGSDIHGFNIAGEDGVYVNAKAKIVDNDTVMVWNDNLKAPKNITYAFANMNQAANLVNSEGIPAAPFRSDRTAATYMTIEEWMFADADAFESKDTNESAVKSSWTVSEGASYTYSESVKTEGKASLEVSYGEATEVNVSPVINTYDGKAFNLANYKNIKLDIKANSGATVSLVVNDNIYCDAVALDKDGFNTILFELEGIEKDAKITFKLSNLNGDKFYIDNIAVGMTDTAAVFGDLNDDAEINATDLILLRKNFMNESCEINPDKLDANRDKEVDARDLVRIKKMCLYR